MSSTAHGVWRRWLAMRRFDAHTHASLGDLEHCPQLSFTPW